MKKEDIKEAIVLLNDGEESEEEGHCNSWPNLMVYDFWRTCW